MRTRLLLFTAALIASCHRERAVAFKAAAVTRGPIAEVVSATGEVSAVVTVNVGSQISGTVSKLYVDWNSPVKEGQVLAEIDPRLLEVAQSRAVAGLSAAEADLERARVALADAERNARQSTELFSGKLVARAELDNAISARASAGAALRAAEARVLQARADREAASTSLALSRIRSPIDGVVISRSADVGQTVAASLQSPTLFVIANDLSRMQVLANVDEADVGKVREGMVAQFTVDAFPGETFRGRIREVRQAPTSIQGVVTYAAVVDAPNPEGKLRQGMTASVTMVTSQRANALRVANAALRYRPSPEAAAGAKVARNQVPLVSEAWADTAPPPEGEARPGTRRLFAWRLQSGRPVRVPVVTGISDGQRTEVISGLAEGDQVVLADSIAPAGGKHGPF